MPDGQSDDVSLAISLTRTVASAALLIVAIGGAARAHAQTRAPGPSNFATLSAKADAARDAGRLDDAASLYRQALAVDPTWQDGWWSLGTILYDQDSYPPAARAFRRLLAYDPKNGTAHLMLALCDYQLDRNDSALQHLATAKRLGVKSDQQLVRVLHYRRSDAPASQRPLRRRARRAEGPRGGRRRERRAGCGAWTGRPVDSAEGCAGRRRAGAADRVARGSGRAPQAGATVGDAARATMGDFLAKEFPAFPNIHYAFGRFLLAVEDTDAAIQQFKEEIENNSRHVRARMQIAAMYYRVDSAAGIPFAQEVVKLEPDYPFGHYLLGLLYLDFARPHSLDSRVGNCGPDGAEAAAVSNSRLAAPTRGRGDRKTPPARAPPLRASVERIRLPDQDRRASSRAWISIAPPDQKLNLACSSIDRPARPSLRLAEVLVQDVVLNVRQVHLVEQIVEIGADLEFRGVTQRRHGGQAERLAHCRIDVEIPAVRGTHCVRRPVPAESPRRVQTRTIESNDGPGVCCGSVK